MKKNWIRFLAGMCVAVLLSSTAMPVFATEADDSGTATETDADTTTVASETATPTHSSGGGAYITIGDTYTTPYVTAGQDVTLVIPIVNYAYFPATDIVISPQVTNIASTWPFEPQTNGYTKHVDYLAPYGPGVDVNAQRADVAFNFKVRKDAYTGYYPLNFGLTYIINEAIETTEITCYIQVKGAPGSGTLEEQANKDKDTESKPRMIVTGFETNPTPVTAGDIFTVTVHVMNTSKKVAVTNALFNLTADVETSSSGSSSTYAAFLPTSGSSSIYKDKIGSGETVDLTLEMQARADLTEKPYVLEVKMTYDAGKSTDLTDSVSVSIPVYQKPRFDTGDESVSETYCSIGTENSLSFSIYNTGRTTLTNVWFRFKDENVDGKDVFVGTVDSGATGYVDASFVPTQVNDGVVHGVIEFEDDAGNVTSVDKEFEIYISEMSYEEDYEDTEDIYIEEEEPVNLPLIIGIAAGAAGVVVLIIVIVVLRKKAKAKKEAELLEDDEDEIEEEETKPVQEPVKEEAAEEPDQKEEPEEKDE